MHIYSVKLYKLYNKFSAFSAFYIAYCTNTKPYIKYKAPDNYGQRFHTRHPDIWAYIDATRQQQQSAKGT